jgi:hypothetical protein
MTGTWLLGGGVVALLLCLLGRRVERVRPVARRAGLFCMSVVAAGAYVFAVSAWYTRLASSQAVTVTAMEPDYFAVQTLTTVGYGGAIAFLRDNVPQSAAEAFRFGATWWMLLGSSVWGFAIAALANVFFSPPEAK